MALVQAVFAHQTANILVFFQPCSVRTILAPEYDPRENKYGNWVARASVSNLRSIGASDPTVPSYSQPLLQSD